MICMPALIEPVVIKAQITKHDQGLFGFMHFNKQYERPKKDLGRKRFEQCISAPESYNSISTENRGK